MSDPITKAAARILVEELPQSLKDKIDLVLSLGASREEILSRAKAITGGPTLSYLAVAAYLDTVAASGDQKGDADGRAS